jgi:SAM-dependent methyltransferase
MKAEFFLKHYGGQLPRRNGRCRVLDVGSKAYGGEGPTDTYRSLFPDQDYEYVGLDIEPGPNVDLVPKTAFGWDEIPDGSFDLCISGQTFEHNPFFWATFADLARILSPNGFMLIIAPGSGLVHKFPHDCWRFYPDAWAALCTMTGMDLVESYFESDETAFVAPGGGWRDSVAVAKKPDLGPAESAALAERLRAIIAPYKHFPLKMEVREAIGPCFADYEQNVFARYGRKRLKALKWKLRGRPQVRLLR